MRMLAVMAAGVLAAQCALAQEQEAKPVGDVAFPTTEVDFGNILDDKVVYAEFALVNEGDGPLTVRSMSSTCGCTKPELVGHPPAGADGTLNATIAPGERATIRVGFKPVGKRGQQDQAVTVITDDPDEPTTRLVVKAHVTPVVEVEPFQLSLGNFPSTERKTWTITVTGYAPDFRATRLALGGVEGFSARTLGTEEVQTPFGPARRTTIEIVYDGTGTPGPVKGYGLIRTTDPRRRLTGIAYSGLILGQLYAMPPFVNAGTQLAKRSENPVTVRIHHRSGKPFNIVEVKVQQLAGPLPVPFEAVPVPDDPGAVDVTVKIRAPARAGAFDGSLWIKSDLDNEPELEVKFRGTVAND